MEELFTKIMISILDFFKPKMLSKYASFQKINEDNPHNNYSLIIKKELDRYIFEKITGLYGTSPSTRQSMKLFYIKYQDQLDMSFYDFVSTHNFMTHCKDNILFDINKGKWIYRFSYVYFIFILIVIFASFLFIILNNDVVNIFISAPLFIIFSYSMFRISYFFIRPYYIAKIIIKLNLSKP